MEIAHAQRDHMTRDFYNKIDTLRQRDSGLQGMIPKSDPMWNTCLKVISDGSIYV